MITWWKNTFAQNPMNIARCFCLFQVKIIVVEEYVCLVSRPDGLYLVRYTGTCAYQDIRQ